MRLAVLVKTLGINRRLLTYTYVLSLSLFLGPFPTCQESKFLQRNRARALTSPGETWK
jgi:hypothetical protein